MRTNLLGIELSQAETILKAEGLVPEVETTDAPRRKQTEGGMMRVVYASDDGKRLVAARFFDPISDSEA